MSALEVLVLGTAAGGGFPQWNCACRLCTASRAGDPRVPARLQASIAVRSDGDEWLLVNATADITQQVAATPQLHPGPGLRDTPVRRVLLTDAQLDHVVGLLNLRHADELEVLAPAAVIETLHEELGIARALSAYQHVTWTSVPIGESLRIGLSALHVRALPAGASPPRYAAWRAAGAWSVAYELCAGEVSCVYAPAAATTCGLEEAISNAALLFFDGTFWDDEELACVGLGSRTAHHMGHMPIGGEGGSLARLAELGAARRLYTHLNNTNPLLDAGSPQAKALRAMAFEVACDGEVIRL